MTKLLFSLLLFLFTSTAVTAQDVLVETRLDSTAILVGEQVRMHVRVSCDKNAKVIFPTFPNGLLGDSIEVLETSKPDTLLLNEGKRMELSLSYLLTSFDSALYALPPIKVQVNGRNILSRNTLGLKVSSVPVDDTHPDELKSPHAPVNGIFEWSTRIFIWGITVWGLLLLGLFFLLRVLRQRPITRKVMIYPPSPPHQVAINEMEQLRNEVHDNPKEQKTYFIRLTDTLRTYIGARFHFNAREMTSDEIVHKLQIMGEVKELDELREIMCTADLVKFARQHLSTMESERSLHQATHYVRATQPDDSEIPQPYEAVIEMGQTTQLWFHRALWAGAALSFLLASGTLFYTWRLLWHNFL